MKWKDILRSGVIEVVHNIRDTDKKYEAFDNNDLDAITNTLINDEAFSEDAYDYIYGVMNEHLENKNRIINALPDSVFILQSTADFGFEPEAATPKVFIKKLLAYKEMEMQYKQVLKNNIDKDIRTVESSITDTQAIIESDQSVVFWEISEVKISN